jgi:hypothetical protein
MQADRRFHIIVSFRTETGRWEYDTPARKLFEETKDKLIRDFGGKELRLEGLSAESIGIWIKVSRGLSLPLVPDLQRIRENSGGLPLLLDEWIKHSKDLKDYEEIKRDQLCDQIIKEEEGLTNEDLVKLYKLAILLQPP